MQSTLVDPGGGYADTGTGHYTQITHLAVLAPRQMPGQTRMETL